MSDWEKRQWQAEQAARDAELDKQREREAKARERSARNAARKLERLHRTLKESGEITDFEDEFSESVSERLGKFGSAFANPELGRPGDALSAAQKKVVAGMNRKVKEARKAARKTIEAERLGKTEEDGTARPNSTFKSKGGFKRSSFKSKSAYTPRVRQLDEDWEAETAPPEPVTKTPAPGSVRDQALRVVKAPDARPEPFIPRYEPEAPDRPPVGKPFLRIVKNDD